MSLFCPPKQNMHNLKVRKNVIYTAGLYFGPDASFDDPDVISGTPMVGPNQYPDERDLPDFANAVKQYRDQMKTVGCVHT